jgi:hypothetical protein
MVLGPLEFNYYAVGTLLCTINVRLAIGLIGGIPAGDVASTFSSDPLLSTDNIFSRHSRCVQ